MHTTDNISAKNRQFNPHNDRALSRSFDTEKIIENQKKSAKYRNNWAVDVSVRSMGSLVKNVNLLSLYKSKQARKTTRSCQLRTAKEHQSG